MTDLGGTYFGRLIKDVLKDDQINLEEAKVIVDRINYFDQSCPEDNDTLSLNDIFALAEISTDEFQTEHAHDEGYDLLSKGLNYLWTQHSDLQEVVDRYNNLPACKQNDFQKQLKDLKVGRNWYERETFYFCLNVIALGATGLSAAAYGCIQLPIAGYAAILSGLVTAGSGIGFSVARNHNNKNVHRLAAETLQTYDISLDYEIDYQDTNTDQLDQ